MYRICQRGDSADRPICGRLPCRSPRTEFNNTCGTVDNNRAAICNDMRRIECAIHQWDTKLPGHYRRMGERAANLGDRGARNVEKRCPDRRCGMSNEHITGLETVEVVRSGDHAGSATRPTRTAWRAHDDASPVAFLCAAIKDPCTQRR